MELVASAQFDTGFYRRIQFTGADGKTVYVAVNTAAIRRIPWFATESW